MHPLARLLGIVALAGLLSCCTSPECAPERLPYRGKPETSAQLFELVQHAARFDCCDALYANLSRATREEHSATKICLFWEGLEIPEPYEYELGRVVTEGKLVGPFPSDADGEEFLMVEFDPDGPDGPEPNLFAQILVVFEPDPEVGGRRPFLGLEDQLGHIEAGHPGYFWDAK